MGYQVYSEDLNGFEQYINCVLSVLGLFDETGQSDNDLHIEFSERLDGDASGYCFGDIGQIEVEIATHVMGVALPIEQVKINIAHELIHAQQIADGDLIDHGLMIVDECIIKAATWKGEIHTTTAYNDQPWEIDAYGRENTVAQQATEMMKKVA